jgi:hypothetical protein
MRLKRHAAGTDRPVRADESVMERDEARTRDGVRLVASGRPRFVDCRERVDS